VVETVLIIDDDVEIRESLSELLWLHGFEAIEAPHGEYGLKMLEGRHVDVLVTDLMMPHKDGVEIIGEAKQRWPELKIVAMSGKLGSMSAAGLSPQVVCSDQSPKLQVEGVLAKPFSGRVLIEMIKDILSSAAECGTPQFKTASV
jgi:CheY-like chemotaxis protein